MNPFTQSTVASPMVHGQADAPVSKPMNVCQTKRRSLVGLALGAVSLATGMSLPAASALPAASGALLTRAGVLAAALAPGIALAIDVNSATQEQLQSVRGIGPKTAQVIIDERKRGGRYESFEDLSDRVKGIGPKKVGSLRSAGLTLGASGPGLSQSAPQKK